jgi:hypothetical protein
VLRRSRTSGAVLQTALCYLEAIRSLFSDEANAMAPEPELNPILPIESSYSLSLSLTPTHPKPVTKCLQQRSFLQTTRSSVRNSLLHRFRPSQCFPPRFFVPDKPFWLRSSLLPSLLRINATPIMPGQNSLVSHLAK